MMAAAANGGHWHVRRTEHDEGRAQCARNTTFTAILDRAAATAETARYGGTMRPDRFQTLMIDHLAAVPGIAKVTSLADDANEAFRSRNRYGLAIHHHNGARTWWQIVATSRPGDDYSQPEAALVTGERQAVADLPDLTGDHVQADAVEEAIAAVLSRADTAGEVAQVGRYSQRPQPGAISHGMTVGFHDGSKIFLNGLASARQGREPGRTVDFRIDATV